MPSPNPSDPEYGYDDPNIHEPEVPVEGLIGSDKIVQDSIDGPHTPPIRVCPTTEQPYPSVETPAGIYTWDPALNALKNISVEAPVAKDLPWGLEVWDNWVSVGKLLTSNLPLLRDIIRALSVLYLTRRDYIPFIQFRCSYNTGATIAWVDPSLDDPVTGTFKRWPSDWDGMLNAELQIKCGLGDKV
jgi:hypothetical protein